MPLLSKVSGTLVACFFTLFIMEMSIMHAFETSLGKSFV